VYDVSVSTPDFTVEPHEGGWMVHDEGDGFTIRWSVMKGFPVPTLLVHLTGGSEHVFDVRHLYTWTDEHGLVAAWEGMTVPRHVARPDVGLHTLDGVPTWLEAYAMRLAEPGLDYVDQYDLRAFRYDPGTGALSKTDVPVYGVIAGTYATADEALAARSGCVESALMVPTEAFEKLKPGLFVLAWFTPVRAKAEAQLAKAKACRPDAYFKQAR
jgi:hypothetical protein